jgi:hypothetical protein
MPFSFAVHFNSLHIIPMSAGGRFMRYEFNKSIYIIAQADNSELFLIIRPLLRAGLHNRPAADAPGLH